MIFKQVLELDCLSFAQYDLFHQIFDTWNDSLSNIRIQLSIPHLSHILRHLERKDKEWHASRTIQIPMIINAHQCDRYIQLNYSLFKSH